MTLQVALIDGPMYDGLDGLLGDEDVEIAIRGDHPTLNREVAAHLAAGKRLDVISTHSKYAPSQAAWLLPLDGLLNERTIESLAPKAVGLCRFRDALLCAPRNIDVRTLWYRTDRVEQPPATWQELDQSAAVFGFPGRESGLFGTFFELVVGAGGRLFDESGQPAMESDEATSAVELLVRFGQRAPDDLPGWHYDQVDDALFDGRVDCAALWPGGYGPLRDSKHGDRFDVAPYPRGDARRVSYAGCHAWAIPTTSGDVDAWIALVERLCSAEAAALDVRGGSVCAHIAAFAAVVPADERDEKRLAITRQTIAEAMITYPPLARFPEIEDAGWHAINAALRGELLPRAAAQAVQRAAEEAMG